MPAAPPRFEDTEEIPSWEDTAEIVDERPPRADFVEPPPMPRSVGATGTWEDESGIPAEIGPEQTRQLQAASEMAAARGEGEPLQRAARFFEPNLPRNLLAPTTEEFLSDGEKFRASISPEMRSWQQSPLRPPSTAAELSPDTRESLAAGQAASGMLADLSSADQALLLGAAAVSGGVPGAAGRILGAAVPATFGALGVKDIYEGGKTLLSDDATPEERGTAKFQIGMGATLLPGFGGLVKRPAIPPRIVETIAKADAVGLTKSAQALADTLRQSQQRAATIEVEAKVEPAPVGERPGGTPPEVTPPREAPPAPVPIETAPLTGSEVIKSIVDLPDAEAGKLKQRPAVEAGTKLTPADVPALEAARDLAGKQMLEALEKGEDVKFQAEYGKNIWFSGAIEGANRKGPNYDVFAKEQAAAKSAPTPAATPDQAPIPARQAPVVEPGVGAVPENVSGTVPENTARQHRGNTASWIIRNKATGEVIQETTQRSVVEKLNTKKYEAVPVGDYLESLNQPAGARAQPFFERESETAGLGRSSLPPTVEDVRAQRARDVAQTDTIETAPLDPASGAPIAPPAKPPVKPPTKLAAAPAPEPAKATLDDVYKIFEPAPKEGKGISQRVSDTVESFRTGFSSKFRPLNKLADDIAAKVGGKAKDIAGIFEQLKGSSGKAEADVYRFDKDVSDLVKGSEKDFNAYVFLRRSLDRLKQDAADIQRAQAGENVPKLNRRRVSQYTIPQLEAKLTALSEQIGGAKLAQFNKAAEGFQTHMDQALRLQVESGRMSPEVYDAIKAGNQFYAPFKVMKYIEETVKPEGSGRKVDTVADFTKAMEGIDDPNVKLGDMLAAARQNLTLSRTLAEKNRAMQNITELAALDVDGNFVQKLKPGAEAPAGMEAVNVLENGVSERYAVNSDVAQAVQNAGPGLPAGIVARWSSGLFRAGATTLNAAFQPVNLLFADAPRASLVSKYGVKGMTDLVRYPMDFVESLFSSISADVFGVKNKLFQDFLDSGAAGTTVQQYLTPEALRFKPETAASKSQAISGTILNTIPQFANAIEQTSKVLGVKRAMRIEGAESGAALAKQIPEAITEIRRFSGSPDFGRSGKWVEQYRLNLVYMFLNARIQGAVADVGRLTGRDGASRAAKTWLKMGTAVGIPTAYLYMLNNSDEYKADYAKRPEQEKQNYWLIPKDTFITGSNGEKIRDYWRVPKREIAQWMGNAVESGLDFANERDPDAFWKWAGGMAESIAPVNIRGNTLQERGESVLSGTHPFIKAPIETFSGRDTYRHRPIVPDSQKKASPEQQYDERTPDVFKTLADKMPDVAPEVFRSPKMLENLTKNFTAGLLTQFLPRQPVEGRSKAENLPLTQRFQAVPYTDSSEFDQRIQKFERESADEQLKRLRDAKAILDVNKGAKPDVLIREMIKKHGRDEKLAERIVDLYAAEQRGVTPQERRVLALPVTQRAEYLADELTGKTPEQKTALLRNWALKRILTERVAVELAPKLKPVTP